ncbi:MAG TPA: alpha/beta fold hydrolase [Burkholderiales bacterium]|nr:alpha/beta fold hydrolase [Burkholderiales bacterium]
MLESVVTVIALVVIGLPLFMYLGQDSLIFHPQRLDEPRRAALAQSPAVQSLFIHATDGTRLHAWHVKGDPLILYFGGNAEEVSWMLDDAARRAPGAGWLLVDYRGYGSSEGSPSDKALVSDALQWYDHFKAAERIYVFGRSLGSGVAVQLAAQRPVAGVILVAPFDSLAEVGKRLYPFLPVDWMLKHRFDSAALAPKMKTPLLCIVASHDEIIPAVHAKRLYDAWGGPKQWIGLEGAGHNSTDGAINYWPSIVRFLTEKPL